MSKRLAFACGGTGGHIYPALALSQHLDQNDHLFLTSSMPKDTSIFERYDVRYTSITVSRFKILPLIRGVLESIAALRAFRADVLFGTGGYVSFPVILAALFLRIPVVLLEQNVIPGRVTKWMHPFSYRLCLSFKESLSYLSVSDSYRVTGNPVRSEYVQEPIFDAFYHMDLPNLPVVLVFGGSQGAESVNRLISNQYRYYMENDILVIHITGKAHYDKYYSDHPFTVMRNDDYDPRVIIFPYFEDMAYLYQMASVVVSRAGATTIAELYEFEKPAILIPYPHAKDNHQVLNAQAFTESGGGMMIEESDLTFEALQFQVNRLILMPPQFEGVEGNACQKIESAIKELLE